MDLAVILRSKLSKSPLMLQVLPKRVVAQELASIQTRIQEVYEKIRCMEELNTILFKYAIDPKTKCGAERRAEREKLVFESRQLVFRLVEQECKLRKRLGAF